MASRKCPYPECIASSSINNYIAQTVFLIIAYVILVGSRENFTPSGVILFVGPPVIELVSKKSNGLHNKIIKFVLMTYALIASSFSVLIMNGTIIKDGAYYRMGKEAVAFGWICLHQRVLAYSLAVIIFIPVFFAFSTKEIMDREIINKYTQYTQYTQNDRKEKVR